MSSKRFIFTLLVSVLPLCVVAQADDTVLWRQLYSDFELNQYVIEIPLDRNISQQIKDRIRSYEYRLAYVPMDSLADGNTAVLRFGFFRSSNEAIQLLESSGFAPNSQSAQIISNVEYEAVLDEISADLNTASVSTGDYYVFAIEPGGIDPFEEASTRILDQAKILYSQQQFALAAKYYSLLSLIGEEKVASWALELLGLCYERMGDLDSAILAYNSVLEDYPDNAGYSRVQQRLRGLVTAASEVQESLRKSSYTASNNEFSTRGVFGQYYRTLSRSVNDGPDEEVLSTLSTDFDLRFSMQKSGHDLTGRINGYSIKDNLDSEDSKLRLKRVLIEYLHQGSGLSMEVGRQRDFDSGVFSSFDGATIGYPLSQNLNISISAGEPVYTSDIYDDIEHSFYSANLEWELSERWQMTSYFIAQTLNDVTDRQAVGLRAQYSSNRFTSSVAADYDTAFTEINNLIWNANFRPNEAINISANFGYQRSPFLTATNILIGQAELDLEGYLQSQDNRDTLLEDALARTSLSQYYSLSINSNLSESLKFLADVYVSDLTEIPSSDFLLGAATSTSDVSAFSQITYGAQLIKDALFYPTESTALGIRRSEGDTSSSTQIFVRERLRFGSKFSVSPKISYSSTQFTNSEDTRTQIRYSLELIYRPFQKAELSLEAGNESMQTDLTDNKFGSTYMFAGYRINF